MHYFTAHVEGDYWFGCACSMNRLNVKGQDTEVTEPRKGVGPSIDTVANEKRACWRGGRKQWKGDWYAVVMVGGW